MVRDEDGLIIAAPGQIVTDRVLSEQKYPIAKCLYWMLSDCNQLKQSGIVPMMLFQTLA